MAYEWLPTSIFHLLGDQNGDTPAGGQARLDIGPDLQERSRFHFQSGAISRALEFGADEEPLGGLVHEFLVETILQPARKSTPVTAWTRPRWSAQETRSTGFFIGSLAFCPSKWVLNVQSCSWKRVRVKRISCIDAGVAFAP